ncbi:MAG: hypothetical protein A2270_07345 [Elusimicrobia bacterium RIFOXYA12_FULL_51_18]|nr:MAG: hypothetical protein A2270_07345 [Elusimicrobia bacterium RIFOXYA12_FULL_51_18]OGS28497.1 MAG: hypothetical protein A2218_05650 [Elusimicrobia bacterium RIFOXYA2_FULL_53_38]
MALITYNDKINTFRAITSDLLSCNISLSELAGKSISISRQTDPIISSPSYFILKAFRVLGMDKYHIKVVQRNLRIRDFVRKRLCISGQQVCANPVFILRVDDFPRWDIPSRDYRIFHNILKEWSIPYLLGVTPKLCEFPLDPDCCNFRSLNEDESAILNEVAESGAEFAVHGCTHKTIAALRHSEIVGIGPLALNRLIQMALFEFDKAGLVTNYFIPPFNSIDSQSFAELSKYFKVICGGPESIPEMGLTISPVIVNDTIFMPSYRPAYGRAFEVARFVEEISNLAEPVIVPLTLHWAWERDNNFVDVKRLCSLLSGKVATWSSVAGTIFKSLKVK